MTNEEAILRLKNVDIRGAEQEDYDALEMAIKALEQEPCEDTISRQAVLDELNKWDWQELYLPIHFKENIIDVVPSVKPQEPKTGHWVMPVQDDGMSDPIHYQVRCSKCGFGLDPQTWHMELYQYDADKYCPKCGSKMYEDKKCR